MIILVPILIGMVTLVLFVVTIIAAGAALLSGQWAVAGEAAMISALFLAFFVMCAADVFE